MYFYIYLLYLLTYGLKGRFMELQTKYTMVMMMKYQG